MEYLLEKMAPRKGQFPSFSKKKSGGELTQSGARKKGKKKKRFFSEGSSTAKESAERRGPQPRETGGETGGAPRRSKRGRKGRKNVSLLGFRRNHTSPIFLSALSELALACRLKKADLRGNPNLSVTKHRRVGENQPLRQKGQSRKEKFLYSTKRKALSTSPKSSLWEKEKMRINYEGHLSSLPGVEKPKMTLGSKKGGP